MGKKVENLYGKVFRNFLFVLNPFKKKIIHTECIIHKYINEQAVEILKNDGFIDAHNFFLSHIDTINEGAVWADQDFKSSSHFYNPTKRKGLYGNQNAMDLATKYYNNARKYYKQGKVEESMFYLGAAVHLVQDMTVPQHANIRLLDSHRQYENFIKRTYLLYPKFLASRGGYYGEDIQGYIRCNARNAINIFTRLTKIKNNKRRYYTIAKFTLPLAQKTTAGCFLKFYKDIVKAKYRVKR